MFTVSVYLGLGYRPPVPPSPALPLVRSEVLISDD